MYRVLYFILYTKWVFFESIKYIQYGFEYIFFKSASSVLKNMTKNLGAFVVVNLFRGPTRLY